MSEEIELIILKLLLANQLKKKKLKLSNRLLNVFEMVQTTVKVESF